MSFESRIEMSDLFDASMVTNDLMLFQIKSDFFAYFLK